MTSPSYPQINLLGLPIELLHATFLFLATDSLMNLGLTCHTAHGIVAKLPSWCRHELYRDQKLFSTPEVYESVFRRAVDVPPRLMFGGDASAYIHGVVSIPLDRESLLPIDAALIVRILDTFTSLRETSFFGCLPSGEEFFAFGVSGTEGLHIDIARAAETGSVRQRIPRKTHCTGASLSWGSFRQRCLGK
ncbi:hypothetical protein M427DRAFT_387261 [Gonapodya prolifera JEL478]|uniref:F-box domain-containing protein n=1 Tax=Gonapodya prolifera (strain JEL478) TaxID=1344416 RepID=A0A139A905_GONPJ|nr:hypothetical protein M427DRAFT_387261 [Gonapodya prolifera JEL478]|eukprot:KXS12945.1 hypothetical protein M427DRAFT_387261 [Gonapodya prolifera JEL478]